MDKPDPPEDVMSLSVQCILGFKNLRSSSQTKKFSIIVERSLNDSHLPNSRTCFNQLILPSYKSYEVLRQKLVIAVTESSTGFGTM